jgi:hypothetical protein
VKLRVLSASVRRREAGRVLSKLYVGMLELRQKKATAKEEEKTSIGTNFENCCG